MDAKQENPPKDSAKVRLTFCDVAARFSEEEWRLLQHWQKEMYKNVMREIHQAFSSLGPLIATSIFSLRPKEKEALWPLDIQELEIKRDINPCSKNVTFEPKVLISGNDDLKDALNTDKCEYPNDTSTGDHMRNSDNLLKVDEKLVSCLTHHNFAEGVESSTGPSLGQPDNAPIVSFKIKREGELYSIDNIQSKRRKSITHSREVGFDSDNFMRMEEGLGSSLMDHKCAKMTEHRIGPTLDPEVTTLASFDINEEGKTYAIDIKDYQSGKGFHSAEEIAVIGREFSDYESLEEFIFTLGQQQKVFFMKKDCRTVETYNKRIADDQKKYHSKFKYAYIKYVCKHFGIYKSQSKGFRPNQRTFKIGCNAKILASVDRMKNVFVIKQAILEHKHRCSENIHGKKS
ncbi:uncharacterized protein [Ambystoma mexicanum]|uniref:uncharacterized protein isoform X1 n=1 Tax=Ambystoma mexicanum TaxID=8296 RepID=UPI0037E8305D